MFCWAPNWNYPERISSNEHLPNPLDSNRNKDNIISDKICDSWNLSNKIDFCLKNSVKRNNQINLLNSSLLLSCVTMK